MPISGWRSCGAGICIPREPDPGLSRPEKNNSFRRFTQVTVLKLPTTEQIMGVDTKSMADGWSRWDRIWTRDRVVFVPDRRARTPMNLGAAGHFCSRVMK